MTLSQAVKIEQKLKEAFAEVWIDGSGQNEDHLRVYARKMNKPITIHPCKHERIVEAKNVWCPLDQDGQFGGGKDRAIFVQSVTYCQRCEHVLKVEV